MNRPSTIRTYHTIKQTIPHIVLHLFQKPFWYTWWQIAEYIHCNREEQTSVGRVLISDSVYVTQNCRCRLLTMTLAADEESSVYYDEFAHRQSLHSASVTQPLMTVRIQQCDSLPLHITLSKFFTNPPPLCQPSFYWPNLTLALSLRFNGHFPGGSGLAGTRMFPFWIILELRMTEVVGEWWQLEL